MHSISGDSLFNPRRYNSEHHDKTILDSSPTGEESPTTLIDSPLGMSIPPVAHSEQFIPSIQRVASTRTFVDSSFIANAPLGSTDKSAVMDQPIVSPATLDSLPSSTATVGANGSSAPQSISHGTETLIRPNNLSSQPIGLCRPRGIGLHGFLQILCKAYFAKT